MNERQAGDLPDLSERVPRSYGLLFRSCFMLSAFTFGGGYVIVPLLKKKFVEDFQWLDEDEMLALLAIAQTAPGPVAVNTAIMLGFEMLGWRGAAVAVAGTVMPPLFLLMGISFFYRLLISSPLIASILEAMQAGVAAVIADVVFQLSWQFFQKKQYESFSLMLLAFVAAFFFKLPLPLLIPLAALLGAALGAWKERRRR